ncbi:hypothetical protein ACJ6WF_42585 [Streptomyces sp. MMS24-I2-30]|uniref:hypothetical protein n=1 Tax=Streptomyces sp. MMS24-I2-30 TaxID=3351564 RepID=UPI003896D811
MDNPRLQVYEDLKAFLTCNHDAFTALCNPDRDRAVDGARHTPDHSRCHPACAHISRTDSQSRTHRPPGARKPALPAVEDHIRALKAHRETARALGTAEFVVRDFSDQIDSFQNVVTSLRRQIELMLEDDRRHLEEDLRCPA